MRHRNDRESRIGKRYASPWLPLGLCLGMAIGMSLTAPNASAKEAPAWFAEHLDFMVRDGGRWVTDNSAYKSEAEPFEAYAMDWQMGLGDKSMKGRLYALKDGKEAATLWEFRAIWHPKEGQALIYQFGGDGTLGVGEMKTGKDGHSSSDQEFSQPNGNTFRAGHRNEELKDGRFKTDSFDILPDGTWKPRRSYTWKRR